MTVYDIKDSNAVGTYDQPGLPNITGGFGMNSAVTVDGAFTQNTRLSESIANGNQINNNIDFDASRSNAIYGNSTTVQPPATEMYLYFYVGQYKKDEIYNAACLNKESIDGKLDKSAVTSEEWTFTLDDNTTLTKKVVLMV